MISDKSKTWLKRSWPRWAAWVLRRLSRTVRTRVYGAEQIQDFRAVAFAQWHQNELAVLPHFGHLGVTILISQSRDGDYLANGAKALGYQAVRGSSSRGAVRGLVALIRAVRSGRHVVIAVDGPQGPKGICKPGIVHLAGKTGVPVIPVGVAVDRKFVFKKTWNQTYLPLPTGRQIVFIDKPLYFTEADSRKDPRPGCRTVEKALAEAQDKAEQILALWRG